MTSSKDFMDEDERRDFECARAKGHLETMRRLFAFMTPEKLSELKRYLVKKEPKS